jgi:hypothetical protein
MSKWEDDFKKLSAEASKAGPVLLSPEQQHRQEKCDAEVTKVCEKYNCVPAVVETTTSVRMNGQPLPGQVRTQILWLPKEIMENPPETVQ